MSRFNLGRAPQREVATDRALKRDMVPPLHGHDLLREGQMAIDIGRRELITLLGGAAAASPLTARAAAGDAGDWIHEWYPPRPLLCGG